MLSPSSSDRRLVPQWKPVTSAIQSIELAAPKRKRDSKEHKALPPELIKRIERWRISPNLTSASEVLETAIVLGHVSEAVEACRVILMENSGALPLLKREAAFILQRITPSRTLLTADATADANPDSRKPKETDRLRIQLSPRDAFAWVELARTQTCAGHFSAAEKSMRVALSLSPYNRHTLRSAARLFFSVGDPERAHDLVRRSPATPGDPWLMAAEVALSFFADRKPAFLKSGLALVEGSNFNPSQITELASAVGTQIHLEGNHKRGRRLIRQSLVAPTGNSLAQAEWLSLRFGETIIHQEDLKRTPTKPWEACAMFAFYKDGNFDLATIFAENWIKDEPYNANAYGTAASIANFLENFDVAIQRAEEGLIFDRTSAPLRGSMAFSLGNVGRLDEAQQILDSIEQGNKIADSIFDANRGLIAFRRGHIEVGINHYKKAIYAFHKFPQLDFESTARAYFACELARVGRAREAREQLEEARRLNATLQRRSVTLVIERAEAAITRIEIT